MEEITLEPDEYLTTTAPGAGNGTLSATADKWREVVAAIRGGKSIETGDIRFVLTTIKYMLIQITTSDRMTAKNWQTGFKANYL